MKLESISGHLVAWVGVVGTLVGGFVGLTTFRESVSKQVDGRMLQAFALHERFSAEPMLAVRERVFDALEKRQGCRKSSAEAPAARQPSNNDLYVLVEFFDVVHACVEGRLCDQAMVERLFVPYANGLAKPLQPFIEAVRKGEERMELAVPFGTGLQRLARRPADRLC